MNYGMRPYDGLTENDFVLPVGEKQRFLAGPAGTAKVYTGLTKWGDLGWRGALYPEKAKQKDLLPLYSQAFNSVELNSTHYAIAAASQVEQWRCVVADGFRFAVKAPQLITHRGSLDWKTKLSITNEFLQSITHLEETLGPIFFQFPETTNAENLVSIIRYFAEFRMQYRGEVFVEFRHRSFYAGGKVDELTRVLNELDLGLVITDTPGIREKDLYRVSTNKTFVRFVCDGREPLDRFRVDQWKQLLSSWSSRGLQECYFYVHAHENEVDMAKHVQAVISL